MPAPADLTRIALEMMARAYAPYSSFSVGAALRSESGKIYGGCNVENAAYPQGTCAEASAISALIAGGDRRITEILVMAKADDPVTPCGGCRQKLREFAGDDVKIHLSDPEGHLKTVTLGELLPMSFGPSHLGK
jgi:cytidine deaminase